MKTARAPKGAAVSDVAKRYVKLTRSYYKRSDTTPLAAFFRAGKELGVPVTVQGKTEAEWKALAKKDMETVFDKLDEIIKVQAGSERFRFDWIDVGKLALLPS